MTYETEVTTYLTMSGIASLVMVIEISSSSTQEIALGHWNLNSDYALDSDEGNIVNGEEAIEDQGSDDFNDDWTNSESGAYEDFQRCLSDAEGEDGIHTQQEMQGCYESNFAEDSTRHTLTENEGDDGAFENGTKEDDFTDDTQDEE
jgi:hypothetical protein